MMNTQTEAQAIAALRGFRVIDICKECAIYAACQEFPCEPNAYRVQSTCFLCGAEISVHKHKDTSFHLTSARIKLTQRELTLLIQICRSRRREKEKGGERAILERDG